MATGLYFPHTVCRDKSLLKSALFLFDELEYIVPYKKYAEDSPPEDPDIRDALDLIGIPIVPARSEQKTAHSEIEQVCKGRIAKKLNFRLKDKSQKYLIFPKKFDHKTWELLRRKKLIKQLGKDVQYDYMMTEGLGHFMMAMLALACAKGDKQLVTDYPDAFKALYLASADDVLGSTSDINDAHRRLLNIRTKSFDFSKVSFARLIELRSKEGALLSDLRANYLATHQECLAEIEDVSENPREISRCVDVYTKKAEKDLKELKQALRLNAARTLLSKSIVTTVAGVISESVAPSSGLLASSAVLSTQLFGYQDKRRELLRRHQFAWLYEVGAKYKLY